MQGKTWTWTVPPDGMVYKLCNYTHAMIPTGWTVSLIKFNDETVWYQYGGFMLSWNPTAANAPLLKYPDTITVSIAHVFASYHVNHYWQMDFWREQARS
jgi:hypothetical protein